MPPIRVLIVDDHRLVAEAMGEALAREEDIEVVGLAASAEEAVAAVLGHAPDVVLMDYQLPGEDGVAATRRIKDERPQTRVVMVTSYDSDVVLTQAIESGCSGFLSKGEPLQAIIEGVRQAAAGELVVAPELLGRLLPRLRPEPGSSPALSPRELEILGLVAEGLANRAIGERLSLSVNTVRNHVQNVLAKLGAHSKLEAVAVAVRRGLIQMT